MQYLLCPSVLFLTEPRPSADFSVPSSEDLDSRNSGMRMKSIFANTLFFLISLSCASRVYNTDSTAQKDGEKKIEGEAKLYNGKNFLYSVSAANASILAGFSVKDQNRRK